MGNNVCDLYSVYKVSCFTFLSDYSYKNKNKERQNLLIKTTRTKISFKYVHKLVDSKDCNIKLASR